MSHFGCILQARKALRRLRGTMRFRGILIDGCYYNQQVSATLKHIHSWSRIQSEMKARRLSMVTEGRLKQKKIQSELKLQAKLHGLEVTQTYFQPFSMPIDIFIKGVSS